MPEKPVKEVGHCTVCGEPCFEILEWNPYDQTVRRIGDPHPDARRVHLVFVDGSRASITVCGSCDVTQSLPAIHATLHAAFAQERSNDFRVSRGGRPLSPRQIEQQVAWAQRQWHNVPIGVLGEQLWSEVFALQAGEPPT